jgi:hypothetical protein
MNQEILEKAINASNQECYLKLANIESNKEWGMNNTPVTIPKLVPRKSNPLSVGMWIFIKGILKGLKP